jgi:hypothetical protein
MALTLDNSRDNRAVKALSGWGFSQINTRQKLEDRVWKGLGASAQPEEPEIQAALAAESGGVAESCSSKNSDRS